MCCVMFFSWEWWDHRLSGPWGNSEPTIAWNNVSSHVLENHWSSLYEFYPTLLIIIILLYPRDAYNTNALQYNTSRLG